MQPKSSVALDIDIPEAVSKAVHAQVLSELGKTAKVDGFRKGKVPKEALIAKLGMERLKLATFEQLIDVAMAESGPQVPLQTCGDARLVGEVEDLAKKYEPGKPVSFSIEVDVIPQAAEPRSSPAAALRPAASPPLSPLPADPLPDPLSPHYCLARHALPAPPPPPSPPPPSPPPPSPPPPSPPRFRSRRACTRRCRSPSRRSPSTRTPTTRRLAPPLPPFLAPSPPRRLRRRLRHHLCPPRLRPLHRRPSRTPAGPADAARAELRPRGGGGQLPGAGGQPAPHRHGRLLRKAGRRQGRAAASGGGR